MDKGWRNELITKGAAFDALKDNTFRLTLAEEQRCEGHVVWHEDVVFADVLEKALLALPPVQPEKRTEKRTETHACDLIDREEATSIPILPKEHRKIFKSIDDAFETGWNEALSCVNMLPSAQPEIVRCVDCIHSDTFHKGADNDMPLKCLDIRYGGVMPDWYCEHAERKEDE